MEREEDLDLDVEGRKLSLSSLEISSPFRSDVQMRDLNPSNVEHRYGVYSNPDGEN